MTDGETFELIGRKRDEYFKRKQERAVVAAKAGELAGHANKLAHGLRNPEMIRWWDGTPLIGQRSEHIVLTSRMFEELTEAKVKQICDDLKRLDATIASLRQELKAMEGRDPD
jgi:hypothetical protein